MNAETPLPADVGDLLTSPTPPGWADAACGDLAVLLNDHANCEKKAAATALSLMFRYDEDTALCERMSRLAREELRHYEQVLRLMRESGIPRRHLGPGRYARRLRAAVRDAEPFRRVDTLIVGAFIEARSCERFALLAPRLTAPLAGFYSGLLAAEARHFRQYLGLAGDGSDPAFRARVREIAALESELACAPDTELRFHSGPPPVTSPDAPAIPV